MNKKRHWSHVIKGGCLVQLRAAKRWARGFRTLQAAWRACHRSDWLIWWLSETTGLKCKGTYSACPRCRLSRLSPDQIRRRHPKAPRWKAT